MNIYSLIKKDHDAARDLMDRIIDNPKSADRLSMFDELKVAILAHAKAEEKTFYEALKETGDEELIEETPHFKKEHKEAEMLFEEIEGIDPQSHLWWERFGELRKTLTHHMEEEEKEAFPQAKQEIPSDEAKELGEEMEVLEEKQKRKLLAA